MCGPKCGVCSECNFRGPGDSKCPVHKGKTCNDEVLTFDGHHSITVVLGAIWDEAKKKYPNITSFIEDEVKRRRERNDHRVA